MTQTVYNSKLMVKQRQDSDEKFSSIFTDQFNHHKFKQALTNPDVDVELGAPLCQPPTIRVK